MSSERAGVHTSGALNREKAAAVIAAVPDMDQPNWIDVALDALEACVVPDPHERMFDEARDGMLKYKGRREVYDFLLSLPDYYGAQRVAEKYGFEYIEPTE